MSNHPIVRFSSDYRDLLELVNDYECNYFGTQIKVPRTFCFDGASIPSVAWQIVGTPFQPRFIRASLVHDWLYYVHLPNVNQEIADNIFYHMLVEDGVSRFNAGTMFNAVRTAGSFFWDNDDEDIAYLNRLINNLAKLNLNPNDYGL